MVARRRIFVAFLFTIGLAVFVWGTAYKLSLYKAPEPGRAPAKLCTRASDASKAELDRAVDRPSAPPAVATSFLHALFSYAPLPEGHHALLGRNRRGPRPDLIPSQTFPPHFRRPPPAFFLRSA